jgi:hypothetical protein
MKKLLLIALVPPVSDRAGGHRCQWKWREQCRGCGP